MSGSGPVATTPVYITDEHVCVRARGDYVTLSTSSERLAYGTDGVFAPNQQWTLSSATGNFQAQGIAAQHIILLTSPKANFPGGGILFAVDSALTNSVTLRVVGKPLGFGMPPSPVAGLTGVTFSIRSFGNLIEDASYDLKNRFGIMETEFYRSSSYIYSGVEDKYRDLRAACVLQTLIKAFRAENRTKKGDWADKLLELSREYDDVLGRVDIQWGQSVGGLQEQSNLFGTKLTRG